MVCNSCPRRCGVNRSPSLGFCKAPLDLQIASVCRHLGEEPPLVGTHGICNVFFAHCNLQCVYCQNIDISSPNVDPRFFQTLSINQLADLIAQTLPSTENILGLVSPSHYVHAIPPLIETLHNRGLFPTVVYNTNAYDSIQSLQLLEPYIDIYLPDLKYLSPTLSASLSHASDYPTVATAAILEMVRQKGSALLTDESGLAFRGIIIRHLVLPGHTDNSKQVLQWIADHLPTNIHISLMAQYFPPTACDNLPPELSQPLSSNQYNDVLSFFNSLQLSRGWVQDLESNNNYRPDFTLSNPFIHDNT